MALHVLAMPRHCTGLIHGLSGAYGWPGCPHKTYRARLGECRCCQTGRRSSCAHIQVFRKLGDTQFSRLFYQLASEAKAWDTVLADYDRWEARQFTIRPSTAPSTVCNLTRGTQSTIYGDLTHGWGASHSLNMNSTWSFGPDLLVAGSISRVEKVIPSAGVSFKACGLGVS